tara:strand:- start:142 stop:600 length:459 start_codon:yes stop_codon:yes gene_type:complete
MKQTLLTLCLIVFALPSWGDVGDAYVCEFIGEAVFQHGTLKANTDNNKHLHQGSKTEGEETGLHLWDGKDENRIAKFTWLENQIKFTKQDGEEDFIPIKKDDIWGDSFQFEYGYSVYAFNGEELTGERNNTLSVIMIINPALFSEHYHCKKF